MGRFLTRTEMDFLVAKLTGSKWMRHFKKVNSFNESISSPRLGMSSYLSSNEYTTGATGKIEYEHFLKLLEMIAAKLYPEVGIDVSLRIIIEDHIIQLENVKSPQRRKDIEYYLSLLMEILKDEDIVNILSEVHLTIGTYYKVYSDKKGLIDVTNFVKFY